VFQALTPSRYNFKANSHFSEGPFGFMSTQIGGVTLYCKEPERWREPLEAGGLVKPQQPEVIEVPNGIMLPMRWDESAQGKFVDGLIEGGVLDAKDKFVAGLKRSLGDKPVNRTCDHGYAYDQSDVEYRDEDVVYGGALARAWGHMLVDATARLWYMKQARERGLKVVFLIIPNQQLTHPELLHLAGLPEGSYEVIERPTRFRNITVPATSVFLKGGHFTARWREAFDAMRETALAEMAKTDPGRTFPKKIYLSRAKYDIQNVVGEPWFERFFVNQGYEPVHLETLPLAEQVATLASAESVATTMGTLAHMAAFCQTGTELIILNRARTVVDTQAAINHMRELDCKLVDAFVSFLPDRQSTGCPVLLAPTPEWEEFARDRFGAEPDPAYRETEFPAYVVDYVSKWGEFHTNPYYYEKIRNRELREIVVNTNLYLNGKVVDPETLPEPTKVANLQTEVARLRHRVNMLESALASDGCPMVTDETTPLLARVIVQAASWEEAMLSICGSLELAKVAATSNDMTAKIVLLANGRTETLCSVELGANSANGVIWTAVAPKADVAKTLQRLWGQTHFDRAEIALELATGEATADDAEPVRDIVPIGAGYTEEALQAFRGHNMRFGAHLARARWFRNEPMCFDVISPKELRSIISRHLGKNRD